MRSIFCLRVILMRLWWVVGTHLRPGCDSCVLYVVRLKEYFTHLMIFIYHMFRQCYLEFFSRQQTLLIIWNKQGLFSQLQNYIIAPKLHRKIFEVMVRIWLEARVWISSVWKPQLRFSISFVWFNFFIVCNLKQIHLLKHLIPPPAESTPWFRLHVLFRKTS